MSLHLSSGAHEEHSPGPRILQSSHRLHPWQDDDLLSENKQKLHLLTGVILEEEVKKNISHVFTGAALCDIEDLRLRKSS